MKKITVTLLLVVVDACLANVQAIEFIAGNHKIIVPVDHPITVARLKGVDLSKLNLGVPHLAELLAAAEKAREHPPPPHPPRPPPPLRRHPEALTHNYPQPLPVEYLAHPPRTTHQSDDNNKLLVHNPELYLKQQLYAYPPAPNDKYTVAPAPINIHSERHPQAHRYPPQQLPDRNEPNLRPHVGYPESNMPNYRYPAPQQVNTDESQLYVSQNKSPDTRRAIPDYLRTVSSIKHYPQIKPLNYKEPLPSFNKREAHLAGRPELLGGEAPGDKLARAASAHVQPEPSRVEPPRVGPPRVEPPLVEPPRVELPRVEPPRVVPPQMVPRRVEPPRVEPPRLEPPRVEPPRPEPPQLEPPRVEPPPVEPPRVEPPRVKPPRVQPPQVVPPRAVPPRLPHAPPPTAAALRPEPLTAFRTKDLFPRPTFSSKITDINKDMSKITVSPKKSATQSITPKAIQSMTLRSVATKVSPPLESSTTAETTKLSLLKSSRIADTTVSLARDTITKASTPIALLIEAATKGTTMIPTSEATTTASTHITTQETFLMTAGISKKVPLELSSHSVRDTLLHNIPTMEPTFVDQDSKINAATMTAIPILMVTAATTLPKPTRAPSVITTTEKPEKTVITGTTEQVISTPDSGINVVTSKPVKPSLRELISATEQVTTTPVPYIMLTAKPQDIPNRTVIGTDQLITLTKPVTTTTMRDATITVDTSEPEIIVNGMTPSIQPITTTEVSNTTETAAVTKLLMTSELPDVAMAAVEPVATTVISDIIVTTSKPVVSPLNELLSDIEQVTRTTVPSITVTAMEQETKLFGKNIPVTELVTETTDFGGIVTETTNELRKSTETPDVTSGVSTDQLTTPTKELTSETQLVNTTTIPIVMTAADVDTIEPEITSTMHDITPSMKPITIVDVYDVTNTEAMTELTVTSAIPAVVLTLAERVKSPFETLSSPMETVSSKTDLRVVAARGEHVMTTTDFDVAVSTENSLKLPLKELTSMTEQETTTATPDVTVTTTELITSLFEELESDTKPVTVAVSDVTATSTATELLTTSAISNISVTAADQTTLPFDKMALEMESVMVTVIPDVTEIAIKKATSPTEELKLEIWIDTPTEVPSVLTIEPIMSLVAPHERITTAEPLTSPFETLEPESQPATITALPDTTVHVATVHPVTMMAMPNQTETTTSITSLMMAPKEQMIFYFEKSGSGIEPLSNPALDVKMTTAESVMTTVEPDVTVNDNQQLTSPSDQFISTTTTLVPTVQNAMITVAEQMSPTTQFKLLPMSKVNPITPVTIPLNTSPKPIATTTLTLSIPLSKGSVRKTSAYNTSEDTPDSLPLKQTSTRNTLSPISAIARSTPKGKSRRRSASRRGTARSGSRASCVKKSRTKNKDHGKKTTSLRRSGRRRSRRVRERYSAHDSTRNSKRDSTRNSTRDSTRNSTRDSTRNRTRNSTQNNIQA